GADRPAFGVRGIYVVRLAILEPAEARFVHDAARGHERPGQLAVAVAHRVVAVGAERAAVGAGGAGLHAHRRNEPHVVDARSERILVVRTIVELEEAELLVLMAIHQPELTWQNGVGRRALCRRRRSATAGPGLRSRVDVVVDQRAGQRIVPADDFEIT